MKKKKKIHSVGKKITIVFGITLLLFTSLGLLVIINNDKVNEQFKFVVEHDAPVLSNIEELRKLVVDMETGQRGFCITMKEEFLEPYVKGKKRFYELIEEEKALVSDNPQQVIALEGIEALVLEWDEKAAKPEIAMARKVSTNKIDSEYLQKVLSNGVGKSILDQLRSVLDELSENFRKTDDKEGQILVLQFAKDMVDQETGQRGFIITGKEEFLEPFNAGGKGEVLHSGNLLSHVEGNLNSERLVKKAIVLAKDWRVKAGEPEIEARRLMNMNPETDKDVASLLTAGTGKKILDQLRGEFQKFISVEKELTKKRFIGATSKANSTKMVVIVGTFFSIIICIFSGLAISSGVSKPIRSLMIVTHAISNGDYTKRTNVQSNDEIGELSRNFDRMTNEIAQARKELDDKANALAENVIDMEEKNRVLTKTKLAMTNMLNDLNETNEKLSSMAEELKRSNLELEQFAYVASHDLQEPLRMVASFTQLLEKRYNEKLDDKGREYIAYAVDGSKRMQKLIDDLLRFSKIGRKVDDSEDVDLNDLLSDIKKDFQLKISETGAEIKHEQLPVIRANRSQLKHLFQNFVSNAIKFCNQKPVINISAGAIKDGWEFKFSDNGIGIEQKYLDKVFVIFQRLHTRKEYEGTGIGLALCKKIVENYGGEISVESELGKGTTFEFTLKKGEQS